MNGVIERFLGCMTAHDWEGLAACLGDPFVRVGPYGDAYRSRAEYLTFISALMPSLPGYSMDVARVTYADGGHLGFAELTETVTVDGRPLRTPEALVFELDPDSLITRVEIFIRTPAPPPPPLGGATAR